MSTGNAEALTEKDVQKHLNVLERLTAFFEAEDDYQAAMLKNQQILLKLIRGQTPGNVDAPLIGIDINDMPLGIAGEITEPASAGNTTTAAFSVRGTRFITNVNTKEDVSVGDIVFVVGGGNEVAVASNAEAVTLFGGLIGYSGADFERSETDEDVTIEPGETRDVLEVSVNQTAWLWEVGTNDDTFTRYQYVKDGNELLEEPLKEPLGLYNDPFRFPVPRKFTSNFIVRVTRTEDASNSADYFSKATYMK